jgi:hypothetical protein
MHLSACLLVNKLFGRLKVTYLSLCFAVVVVVVVAGGWGSFFVVGVFQF